MRRVAFLTQLRAGRRGREDGAQGLPPAAPMVPEDCELLVVVAHWRGPAANTDGTDAPLLACLASLLTVPTRRLEVVVVTDRPEEAAAVLEAARTAWDDPLAEVHVGRWSGPSTDRRVTVEGWVGRWPYRHGHHLTWHHKRIFRRAVAQGGFSHLLYLEDDLKVGTSNLAYWLAARAQLSDRGLLPGFVRFERAGQERFLVDQSRSGQHEPAGAPIDLGAAGRVEVRRSRRPYQALVLLDVPLARLHLRRSPFRSPLRSTIVRWGIRERAAAGETFGPSPRPWRGVLDPQSDAARPRTRHAVALAPSGPHDPTPTLVEGTLIEHLRPLSARGADARRVRVEDF